MPIVLDYTYRISPATLKAAEVVGVCRYLKPDSAPEYQITLSEYRELVGAGISVTLNWEFDSEDWLGGSARGTSHGQLAVSRAKALGYPAGKVIIGSADFDMTLTQWNNAGHAYATAFAAAIRAGGYRPGVYGPWDVLTWVRDAKIMDAFWQCMSRSFSANRNANLWPGAHLRQIGYKTVGGQNTDWNQIIIPNWGEDMLSNETLPNTSTPGMGDRTASVAMSDMWNVIMRGQTQGGPLWGVSPFAALLASAAADAQRDAAATAAIQALTAMIQNAGGNLDAAPIIAAVKAVGDDTHAVVAALQQQVAALQAELDAVKAAAEVGLSPAERAAL